MEEEEKTEEITKVMFLKMKKSSYRKVFKDKVSFNGETFCLSVLLCHWVAKQQQASSRYKPGM